MKQKKKPVPKRQQKQPGVEAKMQPQPESRGIDYKASGRLQNKVALITGGDSGIGRSVAVLFAKEGAHIAIVYKSSEEKEDALETERLIKKEKRQCLLLQGDVQNESFCKECVEKTVQKLGKLNILVNNAAVQFPQKSLEAITEKQLKTTFQTNIFGYFFMAKHALKHLKENDVIINTTSITAYKGHPELVDYASTKGAIVSFTRSLAMQLAPKKIRVNGVAPGPVWTPLIPASFSEEKMEKFGEDVPLKRMGMPDEIATSYVFLASEDSSYMTGQVLHPNGGTVING